MTGCAHQTIAERAGVLEDYLLTSASVGGQQSSAPGSAQPAPGATGTSGTQASGNIQSTYKIEGIADERLKALVGKRVEVTGRVDADDQREATAPRGTTGAQTPQTPRARRTTMSRNSRPPRSVKSRGLARQHQSDRLRKENHFTRPARAGLRVWHGSDDTEVAIWRSCYPAPHSRRAATSRNRSPATVTICRRIWSGAARPQVFNHSPSSWTIPTLRRERSRMRSGSRLTPSSSNTSSSAPMSTSSAPC
jgi:hypothetical protein